nr:MAG: wsv332-like protein [Metapenaeopsis lamellata majanivirus]
MDYNTNGGLFTEGGMCIVNTDSIGKRAFDQNEKYIVDTQKVEFLTSLVTLCHGSENIKLIPLYEKLGKTLIEGVFKNSSKMSVDETTFSDFVDDDSSNNVPLENISLDIIKSVFAETDEIGTIIKRVIKILAGYNPFELKEYIYIIKCNNSHCFCFKASSKQFLDKDDNNPLMMLSSFLQLFCHKTTNNKTNTQYDNIIIVPLKKILLELIDTLSANFNINYSNDLSSFDCKDIHPQNTYWLNLLKNKIINISHEYQSLIILIYCAFLFFPHCKISQTFKPINLYIETILYKMCYNAAEILCCSSINSTMEKDRGNFINYINCFTVSNIISAPLKIEKAITALQDNHQPDLTQIAKVLTSTNHIVREIANNKNKILSEISHIYDMSKLIKHKDDLKNNSRSVKNIELFNIFGEINVMDRRPQLVLTNNLASKHSNGKNIRVNHFHILSSLPRVQCLSSDSKLQSFIDVSLDDNDTHQKTSLGNFGGWWLGVINKVIEYFSEIFENNQINNASEIDMRKMISKTIKEVYKKRHLSSQLMSMSHLPEYKYIINKGVDILKSMQIKLQESQKMCVLSSWQVPYIPGANCSIIAPIQIELALTRSMKWTKFITKIIFFIERFNMDCYRGIFDKIINSDQNNNSHIMENFTKILNNENIQHTAAAATDNDDTFKYLDSLFQQVYEETKYQYVEGPQIFTAKGKLGERRLFLFERIYDILRNIIIDNDQNPKYYLVHSHQLLSIYTEIDDFLIKALQIKGFTNGSKRLKCLDHNTNSKETNMDLS